jgi:hypothetical protein
MMEFYNWLKGRVSALGAYFDKTMESPVYPVGSEEEARLAGMMTGRGDSEDGLIFPPSPVVIKIIKD